ncbi:hypothetical protein B0H12DRAFT_1080237 [Mycena haematopus]|nr:hypothetical protein B0H12DRAFT_1080237 [Mycena haematopus]
MQCERECASAATISPIPTQCHRLPPYRETYGVGNATDAGRLHGSRRAAHGTAATAAPHPPPPPSSPTRTASSPASSPCTSGAATTSGTARASPSGRRLGREHALLPPPPPSRPTPPPASTGRRAPPRTAPTVDLQEPFCVRRGPISGMGRAWCAAARGAVVDEAVDGAGGRTEGGCGEGGKAGPVTAAARSRSRRRQLWCGNGGGLAEFGRVRGVMRCGCGCWYGGRRTGMRVLLAGMGTGKARTSVGGNEVAGGRVDHGHTPIQVGRKGVKFRTAQGVGGRVGQVHTGRIVTAQKRHALVSHHTDIITGRGFWSEFRRRAGGVRALHPTSTGQDEAEMETAVGAGEDSGNLTP